MKKYLMPMVLIVLAMSVFGVAQASFDYGAIAMFSTQSLSTAMLSVDSIDQMIGCSALAGIGNIEAVMKKMDSIENSMADFQKKAQEEITANGKASLETQNILDKLAEQQKEVADRLLAIEQSGVKPGDGQDGKIITMGSQFIASNAYENFQQGNAQKARFEVQNNTLPGGDATVAPDSRS